MNAYFEWFIKKEYPDGANDDEIRKVSNMLNALEDDIFGKLPWLISLDHHPVLITEEKVNDVVKCMYEILHRE